MAESDITVAGLTMTPGFGQTFASWTVDDPHTNGLPYLGLDRVELWAATSNDRATATKVAEGVADTIYAVSDGLARWYWIKARSRAVGAGGARYHGEWYPASPTGGIATAAIYSFDGNSGYLKLPSGVIIQFGTRNGVADGGDIIFPIPFPNLLFAILTSSFATGSSSIANHCNTASVTLSGFSAVMYKLQDTAGTSGVGISPHAFSWLAIGY